MSLVWLYHQIAVLSFGDWKEAEEENLSSIQCPIQAEDHPQRREFGLRLRPKDQTALFSQRKSHSLQEPRSGARPIVRFYNICIVNSSPRVRLSPPSSTAAFWGAWGRTAGTNDPSGGTMAAGCSIMRTCTFFAAPTQLSRPTPALHAILTKHWLPVTSSSSTSEIQADGSLFWHMLEAPTEWERWERSGSAGSGVSSEKVTK